MPRWTAAELDAIIDIESRFQVERMDLSEADIAAPVVVEHVGGPRPFRRRLMELGLLPGTSVSVVRVAPLGDPLELSVRGCRLSIRRSEARAITVRPASVSLPEATAVGHAQASGAPS